MATVVVVAVVAVAAIAPEELIHRDEIECVAGQADGRRHAGGPALHADRVKLAAPRPLRAKLPAIKTARSKA